MTHWWKREPTKSERRNKALRLLARAAVEGEQPTSHSEFGLTLPLVLEAFEDAGVPYILKGVPGMGYSVERYHEYEDALDGLQRKDRAKRST